MWYDVLVRDMVFDELCKELISVAFYLCQIELHQESREPTILAWFAIYLCILNITNAYIYVDVAVGIDKICMSWRVIFLGSVWYDLFVCEMGFGGLWLGLISIVNLVILI